jgi:hypothetical protein
MNVSVAIADVQAKGTRPEASKLLKNYCGTVEIQWSAASELG